MQQQKVDGTDLASAYVDTPDPKCCCPPCGQRLVIHWKVPTCGEKLLLKAKVIFWDLTEKDFSVPIKSGASSTDFYFPIDPYKKNPILTYKVSIEDEQGKTINDWEHKLWVKIIDFKKS